MPATCGNYSFQDQPEDDCNLRAFLIHEMKTATTERSPTKVEMDQLVPLERMSGDSKKDTLLLKMMAEEAHEFLETFRWCKNVRRSWFGSGVGGVYAVFFFEIEPRSKNVDKWLWVIVGDLPPAYVVVDASPTPHAALANYVQMMQEWLEAVRNKQPLDDCIPVNAKPTIGNANLLERRLDFIPREFLGKKKRQDRRN